MDNIKMSTRVMLYRCLYFPVLVAYRRQSRFTPIGVWFWPHNQFELASFEQFGCRKPAILQRLPIEPSLLDITVFLRGVFSYYGKAFPPSEALAKVDIHTLKDGAADFVDGIFPGTAVYLE